MSSKKQEHSRQQNMLRAHWIGIANTSLPECAMKALPNHRVELLHGLMHEIKLALDAETFLNSARRIKKTKKMKKMAIEDLHRMFPEELRIESEEEYQEKLKELYERVKSLTTEGLEHV